MIWLESGVFKVELVFHGVFLFFLGNTEMSVSRLVWMAPLLNCAHDWPISVRYFVSRLPEKAWEKDRASVKEEEEENVDESIIVGRHQWLISLYCSINEDVLTRPFYATLLTWTKREKKMKIWSGKTFINVSQTSPADWSSSSTKMHVEYISWMAGGHLDDDHYYARVHTRRSLSSCIGQRSLLLFNLPMEQKESFGGCVRYLVTKLRWFSTRKTKKTLRD